MLKSFRLVLGRYIKDGDNQEVPLRDWLEANLEERWIEEAEDWGLETYSDVYELLNPR